MAGGPHHAARCRHEHVSSDAETADKREPFDLERIASAMARHQVNCVLIGGASGTFHGMTEYVTRDVDFLVRSDRENRERLAAALRELCVDDTISAAD